MKTKHADKMLDASQVARIMKRLGVADGPVGPQHLQNLMSAYVRSVPWESASRIVKRGKCSSVESCARWPAEFWNDNLEQGSGGTCFESNYAFMCLLSELGYGGYLTVNNMGTTPRCHAALILRLDGAPWLVDVGIPLHAPIRLDEMRARTTSSMFHDYTVKPVRPGVFEVTRDRHPKSYLYTLFDNPIADRVFRSTLVRDYDPTGGLFLDRIIIHKVIDDIQYRFSSADRPWRIQSFPGGCREQQVLGKNVAQSLSDRFEMDAGLLDKAWNQVVGLSDPPCPE